MKRKTKIFITLEQAEAYNSIYWKLPFPQKNRKTTYLQIYLDFNCYINQPNIINSTHHYLILVKNTNTRKYFCITNYYKSL